MTSQKGGPKWKHVYRRVTKDLNTGKTIQDIETAMSNIQAAMQRTEDYLREHQTD